MQRRERILVETRKTERLLASLEAEEKGLREELEKLEKDVVCVIRESMGKGQDGDTSQHRKRQREIQDALSDLAIKKKVAREELDSLAGQFRQCEHVRLSKERTRLTAERVVVAQEVKDFEKKRLEAERRWNALGAQIQEVVSLIHTLEHGVDSEKAPSFVRKPLSDEEKAEIEWKNASNEHFREYDNRLLKIMEMYEPGSKIRESYIEAVLANERNERKNSSINLIKPIARQSERPDFLAGMSVKEICSLPYPEAVRMRDESMGRGETAPPSKQQPKMPLEPGAPELPPG